MPLSVTVSEDWTNEEAATGLRQGLAFSTTSTCRYFSPRFVPGAKGRLMRAKLSVLPSAITPCGGYLNSKPYLELVKVSQSFVMDVGVAVNIDPPPGVDVSVAVGTPDVMVGVGDDGAGVDVGEGGSVGPDTLISTNQG